MSTLTSCSTRPINSATTKSGRSGEVNRIAIANPHKISHSLDLGCVELLTEPDHARSHKRAALRALRQTANVMRMLISSEFTTRTACHENVAVDLHHLICR